MVPVSGENFNKMAGDDSAIRDQNKILSNGHNREISPQNPMEEIASMEELGPKEDHIERAKQETQLSPEQEKHLKTETNKRRAIRVATTGGAVLLSPVVLLVAGVIALSKLLSGNNDNLWDKLMRNAILPAASRKDIPPKPPASESVKHFIVQGKANQRGDARIDGMVRLATGFDPKTASKLPCVVLFCQNLAAMEDEGMTRLADEYQKKGFNVVMFNYRGVGQSEGQVMQGEDLYDDGMAVVRQLIEKEGINLGTEEAPLMLKPKQEDVKLDGSSIGGAVASHVGAQYPNTALVANRTFSTWTDAAEGLGRKYTNPLFAKGIKCLLEKSGRGKMDTVEKMRQRLSSNHDITIIETAGVTGDGILTRHAKLTADRVEQKVQASMGDQHKMNLHEDRLLKKDANQSAQGLYSHNTPISLNDRPTLLTKIVNPHTQKLKFLKDANTITRGISDLTSQITSEDSQEKRKFLRALTEGKSEERITKIISHIADLRGKISEDTPYFKEINELFSEFDVSTIDSAITELERMKNDTDIPGETIDSTNLQLQILKGILQPPQNQRDAGDDKEKVET